MNGLVNQIFTISDESLDRHQFNGDMNSPQRVHTPSHLDPIGLSSFGSPVNHSSLELDVNIPTRDEFGCYGDEPTVSFYQNLDSVKNGIYIDRGLL